METYSDHGCHEGIMLFSVYHEPVQTIIIQDTIVDTFRCSTLLIYILISISTPRDVCVQPDVPLRPGFETRPYLEEVQLHLHFVLWSLP